MKVFAWIPIEWNLAHEDLLRSSFFVAWYKGWPLEPDNSEFLPQCCHPPAM